MEPSTETENNHHISFQMKSLKLCGIWFFIPHEINSPKFWYHILYKIFIGIFVFVIPPLGQAIYLIRICYSGNAEMQEIAGTVNLVLTEILISVRLLDLRSRRASLAELMKQMAEKEFLFFHGPQRDILEGSIKLSRKLFVWLTISSAIDIMVHIIVVPVLRRFKFLPVNMDFIFFDLYKEPYFTVFFIYQILYKPILLVTFTSLQSLGWAVMLYTISQLDILIYNLENMKQLDNDESFDTLFKRNVIHHRAIIQFVRTIEATFGGQFTLFFFINSCIICTTATQFFSIENPLSHVMDLFWIFGFLFIIIGILFIDCYFGSVITEKNAHISTVVYCHPWVDLPKNGKKNLIIFIGRNQRTLVINAAKLIPVSIATFTKVMNWTYKGFAVLNQMKK